MSFPLPNRAIPIVAPFWSDVDTRGIGAVWYRQTTDKNLLQRALMDITRDPTLFPVLDLHNFSPRLALIATWDHVGYYNAQTDKVIVTYMQT